MLVERHGESMSDALVDTVGTDTKNPPGLGKGTQVLLPFLFIEFMQWFVSLLGGLFYTSSVSEIGKAMSAYMNYK